MNEPIKSASELNILRNVVGTGKRRSKSNWVVVQEILLQGTSHAGMTSSVQKCLQLGIDPYGYTMNKMYPGLEEREEE